MGRNFKKKRRRQERSKQREVLLIPKPEIDTGDSLLPSSVAQVGDEIEPESVSLKITFEYYKEKLCGIDGLKEKQPLNVVRAIRRIGSSCNKDDLFRRGIGTQIVHRANEYLDLYKGAWTRSRRYGSTRLKIAQQEFFTNYFLQKACVVLLLLHLIGISKLQNANFSVQRAINGIIDRSTYA
jgi:hypothetical protein